MNRIILGLILLSSIVLMGADSAFATTYIDACGTLSANTAYEMNASIANRVGTCFTIGGNNVTLDCANFEIDGDLSGTDYGIYIYQKNNTIVKNCFIKEFATGIYIGGTPSNPDINVSLYNITSYNNGGIGSPIGIYYTYTRNTISSNITVYNNSGTSGGYGIRFLYANDTYIENLVSRDNFVSPTVRTYGLFFSGVYNLTLVNAVSYNNFFGILLSSNSYATLQDVDVHDNYLDFYGVGVSATVSDQACDTITFSNVTSNGVPYYFTNETVNIDNWNNISGIALCDADGSTISNLIMENTSGIYTTRSDNLVVSNVQMTGMGQLYITLATTAFSITFWSLTQPI